MSFRWSFLLFALSFVFVGCNKQVSPTGTNQPIAENEGKTLPPTPTPPAESEAVQKYKQRVRELSEASETGKISLIVELLKGGADVNDKDDNGRTALHKAAAKGHQGACVTLLSYGADSGEKDKEGITPLMVAAEGGHVNVVGLMLSPDAVKALAGDILKEGAKSLFGEGSKILGKLSGYADATRYATDNLGQTTLHKAAAKGHVECLEKLVNLYGTSDHERLGKPDRLGKTPLMLAAANGHAEVFKFIRNRPSKTVPLLAIKSLEGKTALDYAREGNHANVLAHFNAVQPLLDAITGNWDSLEKAYKADPKTFPGSEVIAVAISDKNINALKKVLELYADRKTDEKFALLAAQPEGSYPLILNATVNDWAVGVETMLDIKWWKDQTELKKFIDHKYPSYVPLFANYIKNTHPECFEVIQKAYNPTPEKK